MGMLKISKQLLVTARAQKTSLSPNTRSKIKAQSYTLLEVHALRRMETTMTIT